MNSEIVQAEPDGEPKRKSFAGREELNAEYELSEIGPGMWKDNPLHDEFVAAMKEARDEINANPNRL